MISHHIIIINYTYCFFSGRLQQRRYLKKGTVPSIFPWTKSDSPSTSSRAVRYQRRASRRLDYTLNSEETANVSSDVPDVHTEIVLSTSHVRETLVCSVKPVAKQTNPIQHFISIETIQSDPRMVHYYTGLEHLANSNSSLF